MFEIWKERNHQPRIIYLAKLSFSYEGEIKVFPDKQKLTGFATIRSALPEMLKGALPLETKRQKYMKL